MSKTFTDQLNRSITIPAVPQRIISLVPSQTEFLYELGLEKEVLGITKFCIHPNKWFRSKTRIGGTKKFHFDRIKALEPDLLIGNKEENEKVQMEQLMAQYPVWMSDIYNLQDAYNMMLGIGTLTGKAAEASAIVDNIKSSFAQLQVLKRYRAAYYIWWQPNMAAANNTFINEMLRLAGFDNVFQDQNRYPEIDAAQLEAAQPEVILLSSEPFPFKAKHVEAFQKICPKATILLVDGELFSWYGSRLLHASQYFNKLQLELLKGS